MACFSRWLLPVLAWTLLAGSPVGAPALAPRPASVAISQQNTSTAANSANKEQNDQKEASEQTESKDKKGKKDNDRALSATQIHNPVLWRQPQDIAAQDLFYGQGGQSHQPVPPFTFEKEAHSGTNPKFDVRDAKGKRWRVKLAEEARPEVVASRMLWAMGYFANDDYLLHEADVQGLKLKRGQKFVGDNGQVIDARFARKPGGQSKIGIWKWKENPLLGSREFNGLRVMMAVINNWDLKDENNAVFHDEKTGQDLLLASDVGASFATTHLTSSRAKDKGNVESFKDSKFILNQSASEVDFATPSPPTALLIGTLGATTGEYFRRRGLDWIGKHIPIADARWMGSLLAQLSHQQLVDAFRAGNFSPEEIDEYVSIVEGRIGELKAL